MWSEGGLGETADSAVLLNGLHHFLSSLSADSYQFKWPVRALAEFLGVNIASLLSPFLTLVFQLSVLYGLSMIKRRIERQL